MDIYISEPEVAPTNIMLSHTSEGTQSPSHSSETCAHSGDMQDHNIEEHTIIHGQPRLARQRAHHSPIMLSDPLVSPASDAKSFDEEDMYGSDPDVETISLKQPSQVLSSASHDSLACPAFSTLFQFLTYDIGFGVTCTSGQVGRGH